MGSRITAGQSSSRKKTCNRLSAARKIHFEAHRPQEQEAWSCSLLWSRHREAFISMSVVGDELRHFDRFGYWSTRVLLPLAGNFFRSPVNWVSGTTATDALLMLGYALRHLSWGRLRHKCQPDMDSTTQKLIGSNFVLRFVIRASCGDQSSGHRISGKSFDIGTGPIKLEFFGERAVCCRVVKQQRSWVDTRGSSSRKPFQKRTVVGFYFWLF